MARYERPAEDVARRQPTRETRRRPVAGSLSAPATAALPSPDAMGPETIASLQRSAGNAGVAAYLEESEAASPDAVLAEPGRSLDAGLRGEMESSLGADFSSVRVHEGGTAAESAHALGARAYTVGEDIVVGSGGSDRKTMAHELTHVVQQRAGSVDGTPTGAGYTVSDPGDPFERAASETAAAIVAGQSPATASAGSAASPGSSAQRSEAESEEEQPVQTAPEDEEIPTVSIEDLPQTEEAKETGPGSLYATANEVAERNLAEGLPTLARGSSGPDVEHLQRVLATFWPVAVDGAFSDGTAAYVCLFQHSFGLGVDGIVGPQTWAKLRLTELGTDVAEASWVARNSRGAGHGAAETAPEAASVQRLATDAPVGVRRRTSASAIAVLTCSIFRRGCG